MFKKLLLSSLLSSNLLFLADGLNQLSFSGGGAFGAVELGIIKRLQHDHPQHYDIYTGISAGGINAGFLSHYKNLNEGIISGEVFYKNLKSRMIYKYYPSTEVSILNSEPLRNTLTNILTSLPNSSIPTYIGATNLYTGNLDVFSYENMSLDDQVSILMCTSAIPVVFPPINFQESQYADGGTLDNELLDIIHDGSYLNITYISPSFGSIYNNTEITSLTQMALRVVKIVASNFNNLEALLNQDCQEPYGELHHYSVDSSLLNGYSMLDFDQGELLMNIGYNNMEHRKLKLC